MCNFWLAKPSDMSHGQRTEHSLAVPWVVCLQMGFISHLWPSNNLIIGYMII